MSRILPVLVVGLFAVALFAGVPDAEAAHQWGHRFMIFGRILDADGEPVQGLDVTLSIKTTQEPHPQMTVETDCMGIYYSQTQQQRPGDVRLDGGRLHIHNREWPSNEEYFVSTPYADYREDALQPGQPLSEDQLRQFAIRVGSADKDVQNTHANIRLDESLDPDPQCPEGEHWTQTYAVRGKVQRNEGTNRVDMSDSQEADHVVDVTIETADGQREESVSTNQAGEYIALFENVTVEDGARITATWEGNTEEGEADTEFRATTVNIVVREWPWESTGVQIFLGILAVVAVIGLGAWGVLKVKDRRETQKARESTTRKRANR